MMLLKFWKKHTKHQFSLSPDSLIHQHDMKRKEWFCVYLYCKLALNTPKSSQLKNKINKTELEILAGNVPWKPKNTHEVFT